MNEVLHFALIGSCVIKHLSFMRDEETVVSAKLNQNHSLEIYIILSLCETSGNGNLSLCKVENCIHVMHYRI